VPDPSAGALGLGRASLWAAVVLALALAAHAEAGAHLPPAGAVVLLGALLLAATAVVVRRRVRWPGGLAFAGAGQYALHRAFAFLGGGCGASLTDAGPHPHPGSVVVGATCTAETVTADPRMLAWHAVATVVSVALLVGVERGVWLLASWLARPLAVTAPRLPVAVRVLAPVRPVVLRGVAAGYVAPVRGPPSSALVVRLPA